MTLTSNALTKLNSIKGDKTHLRIKVSAGGCSGYTRLMEFIEASTVDPKDIQQVLDGITMVVDPRSMLFLGSTELNWSEDLNDGGWKWTDLRATRTCGCGASFAT
jgi:iron-sulfur cluster assembly accessory protein